MALPRTLYLWLVLLTISVLGGGALKSSRVEDTAKPSTTLSGPQREQDRDADRLVQTHYALALPGETANLREAYQLYRALALQTRHAPTTHKALILAHQLQLPLESALVKQLPSEGRALWQALYGVVEVPLPPNAEQQLKALDQEFLGKQALADLYTRQGQTAKAQALQAALKAEADAMVWRRVPLLILTLGLGVVGLGLLFFVGFVALRREWHLLGRVPEPTQQALGWGDLLDCFVFYLALYRSVSVGLLFFLESKEGLILLQVLVQFLTGLAAIAYTAAKARKHDTTLAELGWSRARLGANILYGVGGYLATLPLVAGLGYLAKRLFQNQPDAVINPVEALLTRGAQGWELGLLFVTATVGAPLFEEFFFRGALFTGLRTRFAGLPTILLSALVFAVVHPTKDWLPILGLGFSFAVMRHFRQSVVPGIVAHFLQNTLTFLVLTAGG